MRVDEQKFLDNSFGEQFLKRFPQGASANELISAIESHQLQMEIRDDSVSVIDDKVLAAIKATIPSLLRIAEKPRTQIKSVEEKRPVETAKHISHQAIAKLSRDSNDWYDRKITEVIPKNITAEINVENLSIYENRFVMTLALKVQLLVGKRLVECKRRLNNIRYSVADSVISGAMTEMSKKYGSFGMLNKIESETSYVDTGTTRTKLEDEYKEILLIDGGIRKFFQTDFFHSLQRTQRVKDPIQKTNILMFDYNYNKAYKLWNLIRSDEQTMAVSDNASLSSGDSLYFLYSVANIFSCFHELGYSETTQAAIILKSKEEMPTATGQFVFTNGEFFYTVKLLPGQKEVHVDVRMKSSPRFAHSFLIKTDYVDLEAFLSKNIDEYTAKEQNQLFAEREKEKADSAFVFYCFDIPTFAERIGLGDKLYHRFVNVGDNYSSMERKEDLDKWADYKVGSIVVSPQYLRFNFLRIERIINSQKLLYLDLNSLDGTCPICGGRHFARTSDSGTGKTIDYVCYDCKHKISVDYCEKCDPKKKKPFLWIQRVDATVYLSNEKLKEKEKEKSKFNLMQEYEFFMGKFAVTSFELSEKIDGKPVLKTICPRCGAVLGEEAKKDD